MMSDSLVKVVGLFLTLSLPFSIMADECARAEDWRHMDVNERLKLADVAVYGEAGKTTRIGQAEGSSSLPALTIYNLNVLCVFKKANKSITDSLPIHSPHTKTACFADTISEGEKIIVTLKEINSTFRFDNVNLESAVFLDKYLQDITSCSGVTNPTGSGCPDIKTVGTEVCSSASTPSSHLLPLLALAVVIAKCLVY